MFSYKKIISFMSPIL